MDTDLCVLIVDDDEDIRLLCRLHLERRGYRVTQAADGAEALEVARADRPDLILLDVMMPVMDGWECLAALKADASLRSVPVFIVTGKTQREDQEHAMSSGAVAFVPKPFNPAELVALIGARLAAA